MRFSISLALFVLVFCGCGDDPSTGDAPPTIDGYTYKTVKIGDQEWFAENLRTTVYANGDEIQYYRGATVKCRHILLKTDDINDDAQLATLEARADSLKRRLRAGDEFADLVNKHSEDPGSKATGGEYEFQRGRMVRPFEDFCFGNRVGTVGTAKTNYGLHLIEVLDQQLNNCNSVEAQELGIRCSHHHADSMNVKYGQLYNWYVVDDERGLCPSGWHVPTLKEWKNLEDYIVSQGLSGKRGRRALMSMTGWLEKFGEGSGTDDFGFSGLPGGSYSYNLYEETVEFDGANDDYGDYGCWWSSSTKSGDNWSVQLPVHSQGRSLLKKYPLRSCTGASVRCLKDTERQRAGDKEDPLPIIDGYTYKTVKIGDQEWFAENLRTTVYANGDEIPYSRTDESWTTQEMGMRCSHHHADSMNVKYGQLYNWYTVDDERGLCPSGWHVPTDGEWAELEDYISAQGFAGNEGAALKSTSGWIDVPGLEGNGTDEFGFSALPGGDRNSGSGWFGDAGRQACWWSSSLAGRNGNFTGSDALYRFLYFSDSDIARSNYPPRNGLSVRCLRDAD